MNSKFPMWIFRSHTPRHFLRVSSLRAPLSRISGYPVLTWHCSHSVSTETYRNRYTHYRKAYPGKPKYWYAAYVLSSLVLLGFFSLGGGLYLDTLEADYINKRRKKQHDAISKVKCESVATSPSINPTDTKEEVDDDDADQNEDKKKRIGFRDRKFIAYEDRIRAYSTPDKIFRYFATLKSVDEDGECIYMTPDDFVRAITPGLKQPDGLDLDNFLRYDPKRNVLVLQKKNEPLLLSIPEDSIFYRLCDKALITFTDFVFLLTVLSTPRRQFEIAFRMFDLNGDGELDADEFDVVRNIIMGTTSMGRRHRDHATTGSKLKRRPNSALQHYFFGPRGDQKLSVKRFLDFQFQLQEELTRLEFDRASPVDGKISEIAFSKFLLTYGGFSDQKRRKMLRRIKQKFPKSEENQGIIYRDFADLNMLLRSISDVDTALTFHHMAGAAIDRNTLKHVALTVAGVKLSDHVVDVVFTLFDENNDGQLSYREFVGVMRHRLLRGLDKSMDTGFIRFVNALFVCAKEQTHDVFREAVR